MSSQWRAILAVACLTAFPMQAALTQRCNWGATAPAVWPNSVQVISTPIVLNFAVPGGFAQVAFVSFENAAQANRDGGGVLRVMDRHCQEIARFPDSGCPFPPVANAPAGFGITPDLAPFSGITGGNIDNTGTAEIIGVIGGPTKQHRQIAAFNLVGGCLVPKWVSPAVLLPGDPIMPSAPALAQLDRPPAPGWADVEIILDNKIFNANGSLRFTGFAGGTSNCAFSGGPPCPRSQTVAVANIMGTPLPQMITGRGIYVSLATSFWTFTSLITTLASNLSPGLSYPAIAELDPSLGPEIVVTDTMTSTLFVFRATGGLLASAPIPSPGVSSPKCGGPPMIGNAAGGPGPEIGVASCSAYTLFRYNAGGTLTQVWTRSPTFDPGGQTTSTLYNGPSGPRIVYTDARAIQVLNGATGAVMQTIANSSATAWEGPVIASFDTGNPQSTCHMGPGNLIVVANNISGGSQRGVRIFDDPDIGQVASCWNEHGFHVTNLGNSFGAIPPFEAPSWAGLPARNTYRVQAWP